MTDNTITLILTTPDSKSVSPLTPSRGLNLFRAISRKLSRHSKDSLEFEDRSESRSSSSDSCRCASPHYSSEGSETGSDAPRRTHSTSVENIRRVFLSLNLGPRSQSCSTKPKRKPAKKTPPKKILRTPVSYTYVKGLSGLPTQRVPRTQFRAASHITYGTAR